MTYLNKYPIVIFDFETTGLDPVNDEIIQIAAVSSKADTDYFNEYLNVDFEITNSFIHKITNNYLNENVKDSRKEVLMKFKKFITKYADKDAVFLLAHNNFHFDSKFLEIAFKKHNISLPKKWYYIDSYPQIKYVCPGFTSYALGKLYKRLYGTLPDNPHNALTDIKMLYKVYLDTVVDTLSETDFKKFLLKKKNLRINSSMEAYFKQPIELMNLSTSIIKILKSKNINSLRDVVICYQSVDDFDKYLTTDLNIQSSYYKNRINFWAKQMAQL
uniref:Exonuclease domain-containing protein n=1 Tax=viral metagenome TaxID=1070528 RepID=A0A6C0JAL1_9ZZZZ